jgi:hypothetical protein
LIPACRPWLATHTNTAAATPSPAAPFILCSCVIRVVSLVVICIVLCVSPTQLSYHIMDTIGNMMSWTSTMFWNREGNAEEQKQEDEGRSVLPDVHGAGVETAAGATAAKLAAGTPRHHQEATHTNKAAAAVDTTMGNTMSAGPREGNMEQKQEEERQSVLHTGRGPGVETAADTPRNHQAATQANKAEAETVAGASAVKGAVSNTPRHHQEAKHTAATKMAPDTTAHRHQEDMLAYKEAAALAVEIFHKLSPPGDPEYISTRPFMDPEGSAVYYPVPIPNFMASAEEYGGPHAVLMKYCACIKRALYHQQSALKIRDKTIESQTRKIDYLQKSLLEARGKAETCTCNSSNKDKTNRGSSAGVGPATTTRRPQGQSWLDLRLKDRQPPMIQSLETCKVSSSSVSRVFFNVSTLGFRFRWPLHALTSSSFVFFLDSSN